jgi:hypothetical protein
MTAICFVQYLTVHDPISRQSIHSTCPQADAVVHLQAARHQYMQSGLKRFFDHRVEGSAALYKVSCYVISSAIISTYGSAHYNTDFKLMNFS